MAVTCKIMPCLSLLPSLLPLLVLPRACVSQLVHDTPTRPLTVPRIGVVGGGIGGTATAYFLKELFGDEAVVDVYEPGHVGGRLATLPISGRQYEVGGSVIHPSNQYMKDFVSKFSLSEGMVCPQTLGLFTGNNYVYSSSNIGFVDLALLFKRYGWDIYRLKKVPAQVVQDFIQIYQLQHQGKAFKTVASMLSTLSAEMLRMTQMSTTDWLIEQGFNTLTIDELVMAVTQCNYGQTPAMHAFVGLISVAGADDNLWSVQGGNKKVAEELLRASRASLLRRRVTRVTPSAYSKGKYMVQSHEVENPEDILMTEGRMASTEGEASGMQHDETIPMEQEYDIVILATPMTQDKSRIKLLNFTREFTFPGRYETIYTTLVHGSLHPESLLLTEDSMLDEIFVTNPKLMFNSLARQLPVDQTSCERPLDVWKIFSPQQISEKQLDIFFKRRGETQVVSWLAYPHYSTNQTLGDFELQSGLYHLNAIEWAGSAMEMSVIGAKNVALLAYKHWKNDPDAGGKPPIKEEL